MLPTTPATATHDYERNGTCDLFAALDVASGKVITDIRARHTREDFLAFLGLIDRNVPKDLDVHVILDNLSAHKIPKVKKWLLRHRRFHLHFTPTYGSWMNITERWFSALTTKKLQRSAHRSMKELAADIKAWAAIWNEDPKPFVWHKTAEQIRLVPHPSFRFGQAAKSRGQGSRAFDASGDLWVSADSSFVEF
jgi:transposase